MKILYSAGNRVGADLLYNNFRSNYDGEIKLAAYVKSGISQDFIDWTLDAVYNTYTGCNRSKLVNLLGRKNLPMMGYEQAVLLLKEIDLYGPDLVICDYEPIVSNMAAAMGIPLWYCSPVHLLDGVKWKKGQLKYFGLLEIHRKVLSKLPRADKVLINSPFSHFDLDLEAGYERACPTSMVKSLEKMGGGVAVTNDMVRLSELSKILNCIPPYDLILFGTHKYELSHLESYLLEDVDLYKQGIGSTNWLFSTGESQVILDGLKGGVLNFGIAPDLGDPEALLNAILINLYELGDDLGQIEYMEHYCVEEIKKSYHKTRDNKIKWKNIKTLEENIKDLNL